MYAQQRIRNFIVYGKENGLTQSSYHDVFESSNGYWWIGSNNGLFRFDGKRFEQIISSYNNPNSPTDNNIVDFEEDNSGNLWIAGFSNGLTRYNLKTGKFQQYKRLSGDSGSVYPIPCILKDNSGQIWLGTGGRGIAKYLAAKDTFQFYIPNPAKRIDGLSLGDNHITGMLEDNADKNILWVSSHDGLYRFNKKTSSFTHFDITKSGFNSELNFLLCIEQIDNQLFLGTWFNGLIVFDKLTGKFTRIKYNNPGREMYHYGILDMQVNTDSILYLAAMNDGLLAYSTKTKNLSPILTQPDINHLNTEINIQRLSLTPHAGFFAGGNSAIYQLHPGQNKFNVNKSYSNLKIVVKAGGDALITSSIYDNNKKGYWMTFFNNNSITFYDENLTTQKWYDISKKDTWMEDITVDGKGRVWAVSHEGLLYVLNELTNEFEKEKNDLQNIAENKFDEIESDTKGNFWLAGRNAVFYYNISNKKLTPFPIPFNEILRYSKKGIIFFSLKVDSKNNAWMSTNTGLLHFDLSNNETRFYYKHLGNNQYLASSSIKSIAIDKDDNIWLGYFNEGIQVIDTKKMSVSKSFSVADGLTSMEINYMACDDNNNILACLHSGLAVYNRNLNAWQIFTALDGLQRDYLDAPIFANHGNQIVLRQNNGFTFFNTDSLWLKKDSSVAHITSLLVNGTAFKSDVLPDYINALSLSSNTRDIYIAFAATNWQFPFRTKYFYRVDGIHKPGEWITANEASANLTGLASGNYTFRFYAITNDGIKTPDRLLKIEIKAPFYKTWWFILLCLILVSYIIYSFFKYRINQLKKLQEIRNSISRNLHDDIGASLSNINILNELAKRNAGNTKKQAEYLDKASEDIQQTSENLSDIVWNINPHYDDLNNLLIRMKRYAADMMEGKNINYNFKFPETLVVVKLPMDKRRNFFLIFKEAVNNLAKYSGATQAGIHIHTHGDILTMEIEDNGKGFDMAAELAGNGLKNMQQRAALCNGSITITAAINMGTKIVLSMPV